MKIYPLLILGVFSSNALLAIIPVTDYANLINNQIDQIENMAKWVESIAQLKIQVEQMKQQIALQTDLRNWSGSPAEAGAKIGLDKLGLQDLDRTYGLAESALRVTDSLASLKSTGSGAYFTIDSKDLGGEQMQYTETTFRRYSLLDAKISNAAQVSSDTEGREGELQSDIGSTLAQLKSASTQAEAQKLSAKLDVLNGQLAQVESERKRTIDEAELQKVSNDSRSEEERNAAAELEARDAYLTQQRVSAYMKTLHFRSDNQ